ALTAAETALALAPDDREVQLRRFDLLVASRRWDRVAGELDAVTATAMARRTVIQAHAHFAFANGNPEALLSLCEAVLARQPGHTFALHQKAVALAMLGRDAEARAVIGIDDFVVVGDLPLQDERIDGGGFLDTLAAEILRNRTLVPDPRGKATRGGLQTRVLVQAGDKAMPLLIAKIRSAVERYVEALPDARHPFVTTRPPLVQLKAWAVVYPQDGRQASHLHPGGWISGVTYITAPRAAGTNAFSGPLVLGALDAERHLDPPPWGTHNIEPMPGRIVLFPSFVPHATEPTGLAEQRICVAFDVEPPQ
ncbi:MAG: putative 2OG-Fe(II) oxygenase, partial [Xanthobacteraceae bacterium]